MVVGTVAEAVTVVGVDAVWVAVEALLVHVSFWSEQSLTPNAAPARPEQMLNCDMQAALAAEGRSSNVSSSTMKNSPSEVTPGGRPPRERMNSKKVITSTMVVVVVTVVATTVVEAAVGEAARVVAGVVVVSMASTAEALLEVDTTSWAVVDELPKRGVVAMVAAVVDAEIAVALDAKRVLVEFEAVLPDVGWMVPARISYRSFLVRDGLMSSQGRAEACLVHTCKT